MKTQADYNRVNILGLIAIMLISVMLSFTSCNSDPLQINSNVEQYTKTLQGTHYLVTLVRFEGNQMSREIDILDRLSTDSIFTITQMRYNEAHTLLRDLQAMKPEEDN
jgi:hypothetical protein